MYLSVDIGGTKTLVALFSERGRVSKKIKFKTARDYDDFLAELLARLRGFVGSPVKVVTIAVPGTVQKICSVSFGNRDWVNKDLYTPVRELFHCPVYVENDASLAAFYEAQKLKGKTVFLTFSTGIGGGIIENGQIAEESSAFEPGHTKYLLGGKTQEWEDIASAKALEEYFQVDQATELRGAEAMKEIAARIAMGLPDIISKYHPRTIILGGPMGKIFKLYAKYLPKMGAKLIRPRRPNESVIYGCYLYSKRKALARELGRSGLNGDLEKD